MIKSKKNMLAVAVPYEPRFFFFVYTGICTGTGTLERTPSDRPMKAMLFDAKQLSRVIK